MRFRLCCARVAPVALVLVASLGLMARAENWPSWRGPQGNGLSGESDLPLTWGTEENVLWRLPLPGPAGSTPVVFGDRIFLTSSDRESDELGLLCLNTAGEELWRRSLGTGNTAIRGDEGNLASPSPCTDGQRVYVFCGQGSLACFDFDGNELWGYNAQDKFGEFDIQFGMASTPVLYHDRLYLQLIHSGGARVIALDKLTGDVIWNVPRPSDARDECEHSYASPILYDDGQQQFLLTHGADYIVAHDLETGEELWRCGGLHPPAGYEPTLRFVASPAAAPGLIIVPTAKQGPLVAVKPGGSGDITNDAEHRIWEYGITPDVPSPLVVDDLVYLCRENGNLICLDAATGEELYHERCHRERHRASPVYADGYIYLTARDGTVSVVRHGRQFELVGQNTLDEEISSSPVISGGRIYLRSFDALWAIGK